MVSISILLGAICGFFVPFFGSFPDEVLILLLGMLLFQSCFRIERENFETISAGPLLLFYLGRFVVLPIGVYFFSLAIIEPYSVGLFLFFLLPAGVTAPILTGLFRGNVALALVLTVLSSLLAPFSLPYLMSFFAGARLEMNPIDLYKTLSLVIFIPIVIHLPLRKIDAFRMWILRNGTRLALPNLFLTMAIAVAKRRSEMLSNMDILVEALVISSVAYVVLFLWGFYGSKKLENRVATCFASGTNNIILGIVLALLHFPGSIGTFMVIANLANILAWILVPIVIGRIVSRSDSIS